MNKKMNTGDRAWLYDSSRERERGRDLLDMSNTWRSGLLEDDDGNVAISDLVESTADYSA